MKNHNKKVIIVEDDYMIALLEKKLLTRLGYDVITIVREGRLAVEAVSEHKPDLVIMDIRLADDVTGLVAAKEIWKTSNIPIVFISGNIDMYLEANDLHFKRHSFVSKPFSEQMVSDAIKRAISNISYRKSGS